MLVSFAGPLIADQIQMRNGDRYVGKVLSLSSNVVVFESSVLGRVNLSRGQVATINLFDTGTNFATMPATKAAVSTNHAGNFDSALQQLRLNTNSIAQVRNEFLAGAPPEANQKFDDMLNGLLTGKLTLTDLRKEAQTAADQLRELKKDLGEESGFAVDGYLSILENFLRQTPAPAPPAQNPASQPKVSETP
jgi:hypothetical protein